MHLRTWQLIPCLSIFFVTAALAQQMTPSWGTDTKGTSSATASGQPMTSGKSDTRPPPPSPASGQASSKCVAPPARPPGMAQQIYDPLALGLEFRGIKVSSMLQNVTIDGAGRVYLSKDSNSTEVKLLFTHPGECREIPAGAYTAGIDLVIVGNNASGAITIIDGGLNPNDPVMRSCPLVLGAQRCTGWFNTLNQPHAEDRWVTIKFTGQNGILQGRIVKIVVDVP